jgi:hypothetical protein
MSFRMRSSMLLAAIVVLAVGCGGSNELPAADGGAAATTEATAGDPEAVTEEATEAGAAAIEEDAADGGGADDWCALLPTDEVEALFDGQLELDEPRSLQTGGCTWPVVGAEGEGLMVANTSVGTFEALAAYEDGGGVDTERLELGDEALLLNGADLAIRRGGEELRIALQAIFFSEEMGGDSAAAPDPDVARQGLIDLAALVLERT